MAALIGIGFVAMGAELNPSRLVLGSTGRGSTIDIQGVGTTVVDVEDQVGPLVCRWLVSPAVFAVSGTHVRVDNSILDGFAQTYITNPVGIDGIRIELPIK